MFVIRSESRLLASVQLRTLADGAPTGGQARLLEALRGIYRGPGRSDRVRDTARGHAVAS